MGVFSLKFFFFVTFIFVLFSLYVSPARTTTINISVLDDYDHLSYEWINKKNVSDDDEEVAVVVLGVENIWYESIAFYVRLCC